ncbi:MAG: 50S ribosomal protein L13 [Candidatus Nomurabacteria bacterium]|jgi:large subunit ribosomal protein L13|nr:50S ribosomal protein L13 [Candidatus Nomurabacteria bacterium]
MKFFKTYSQKPVEVQREWFLVDASTAPLGKIAVVVADKLLGKSKVSFTSHVDNGDFVVVVNASKVQVTGGKEFDKKYYRHSGYQGGLTELSLAQVRAKNPSEIIINAVRGMLPKNKLLNDRLKRLKVFAGEEHAHVAQTPKKVEVKS